MKRPRRARADATRNRILDAAEALFEEVGFARTSMSAVARSAEVSAGGLYEWFADKEQLLLGVAERHVAAMRAAVAERLADERPHSLEAVARCLLEPALAAHRSHPRLHRFLYAEAPRPAALQAETRAIRDALEREIAAVLARDGLPEADAALRAALVYRAGEALLHEFVLDDRLAGDPEGRLDQSIASLLRIAR